MSKNYRIKRDVKKGLGIAGTLAIGAAAMAGIMLISSVNDWYQDNIYDKVHEDEIVEDETTPEDETTEGDEVATFSRGGLTVDYTM